MDSGPLNRFAAAKTLAHRFQHRTVRPDLRMAIHAGLGRRNARERALFDRGVDDETGAAKNGETGNGVGARMKNLRHDLLLCRGAAKPAQSRIT